MRRLGGFGRRNLYARQCSAVTAPQQLSLRSKEISELVPTATERSPQQRQPPSRDEEETAPGALHHLARLMSAPPPPGGDAPSSFLQDAAVDSEDRGSQATQPGVSARDATVGHWRGSGGHLTCAHSSCRLEGGPGKSWHSDSHILAVQRWEFSGPPRTLEVNVLWCVQA